MPFILSVTAIGVFFMIVAIIESILDGDSPTKNTLRNNKRHDR